MSLRDILRHPDGHFCEADDYSCWQDFAGRLWLDDGHEMVAIETCAVCGSNPNSIDNWVTYDELVLRRAGETLTKPVIMDSTKQRLHRKLEREDPELVYGNLWSTTL